MSTPIPRDEAIIQLNIAKDRNQPNDLLDGIPDFHFLNLKEEAVNILLSDMEHHLGSPNPDATIKAYLFRHADAPSKNDDSMADSIDNEFKHKLMFIHVSVKYDHVFLQKGSINPNCILLDTGSSATLTS